MSSLNHIQQNENIKSAILKGIKAQFPLEGNKNTLVLNDVWITDNLDYGDFAKQREVKLNKRSWVIPAYADVSLVDKNSGALVDRVKRIKIADIPKLTNRFSVIVDGNEYQTTNQFRLKTGIYTRVKGNGQLESQFNLNPGFNFKMTLNPESSIFFLNAGNKKYRVYNIMRHVFGLSDGQIKDVWGKDIFNKNFASANGKEQSEIIDLYERVAHEKTNFEVARKSLAVYFAKTGVSTETTKLTLGQSFDSVSGEALLATSRKLLSVMRGDESADERDSQIFKDLYTVDDLVEQFFLKRGTELKRGLGYRLDSKENVRDVIGSKTYGDPIKDFFTKSDLVSPPPQTNPVNIVDEWRKTTITGTGGVGSSHAITMDVRNVHPSTIGFLDPVNTPESGKVGVTLGLSIGADKRGKELTTRVLDLNGKDVFLSALEFGEAYIGFPDEFIKNDDGSIKSKNKKVRGVYKGVTEIYPADKIQYYLPSGSNMFTVSTNMIPFLAHNQGNRAMMGSRMMGQALAIEEREAPLVRVKLPYEEKEWGSKSFEDLIGNILNPTAGHSGKVTKITDDYIYVRRNKDNVTEKHGLYKDFPLNQEAFLDSTPLVSVGDEVKKNQILAENNYNKDGHLALGRNVRVAYMPWHGYNFEDAAVVTESFAKNFTSAHIIKKTKIINNTGVLNLERFKAYFPDMIDADNTEILDESGIVTEGSEVLPGQTIIAYMEEKDPSTDEMALKNLHRTLANPMKPQAVTWDFEEPGIVTDVVRLSKQLIIYVKVKQPLVVGDKIAGKHGNKSIVAKIIPDNEAPHTANGDRIDLMLNPHGVPGRINVGQILETAAGKLARKTGEPYVVENFDGTDHFDKLKKAYKEEDLEFDETLVDGESGKEFKNKVFTGTQYIMKLHHTVEHKLKARAAGTGAGYDINEQPSSGKTGGQSLDTMMMYGLLAHGAKSNLYETSAIKGQQNDEYWRALQLGLPIPVPQKNFSFDKMMNMLKAAGVNTEKKGNKITLLPLTDKDTLELSSGELVDAAAMLRGKNLAVRPGGLFDEKITGGNSGTKWAHVDLAVKIPNPMFQEAITKVLGITTPEFNRILKEEDGVVKMEGMLSSIDVDASILESKIALAKAPDSKVNTINKKIRYLQALKKAEIRPEDAYMMKKLPIIPPVFRPIYPLPSGDLMVSTINKHYKDVATVNDGIKKDQEIKYKKGIDSGTEALYLAVKAMQGFIDPITYTREKYEGVVRTLAGSQPKQGFIQNRVWSKKQDLSARSTITLEPSLGLDEVGLPDTIAKVIYKPFIIKKLIELGMPAYTAREAYTNWTDQAEKALDLVMEERPVMLNRAPSLHKHSVQAFKPVKLDGKSIKLNPLIVSGFNADFNGDSVHEDTIIYFKLGHKNYSCTIGHLVKNILFDKVSDKELLEMAKDGTLILQVDDLEVLGTDNSNHVKYMKATDLSIHTSHGPCYEVKLPHNIPLVCTEHHNISFLDTDTLEEKMIKTEDMVDDMIIPLVRQFTPENQIDNIDIEDPNGKEFDPRVKINKNISLNFDSGYWFGYYTGDGSVMGDKSGSFNTACANEPTQALVMSSYKNTFGQNGRIQDFRKYACGGHISYDCSPLARWLKKTFGHGAKNKKFPEWYLNTTDEFRKGLIAGLIDSDGSVTYNGNLPIIKWQMISKSVILQLKILLKTFGIQSSVREENRKTTTGNTVYQLTIDSTQINDVPFHKDSIKLKKLKEFNIDRKVSRSTLDMVPFNNTIYEELFACGKKNGTLTKVRKGIQKPIVDKYCTEWNVDLSKRPTLADSKDSKLITRTMAHKLVAYCLRDHDKSELMQTWINIVHNYDIKYLQLEYVRETERAQVTYDFSLPQKETFVVDGGIITHNTMSVHVPIGRKAVDEAYGMMPSKSIYKAGDNEVVPEIAMEYMLGLYYLTRDGKKTNRKFDTILAAQKSGIADQDIFTLKGVGKTTIGRYIVNQTLPTAARDYTRVLDKKTLKALITNIAKNHNNSFAGVMNSLKDLGNQYSHEWGASISFTDMDIDRGFRDKIVMDTAKKIKGEKDPEKIRAAWSAAKNKIKNEQAIRLRKNKNRIQDMLDSGSAKKEEQATQMIMFPGLFEDIKGNILPEPFVKSYAEGFNTFDYWNGMYGVRKGAINTAVNTQETGALNKELLSLTKKLIVVEADCETTDGVHHDVNGKDALDRYLVVSIPGVGTTNTIVDGSVIIKAKAKNLRKLFVRSPLTCDSVNGLCQKCYGLMPGGELAEIGTNVGIMDSQALTERATQLTLQTRHTGGAVGGAGAVAGSFPRLRQLFDLPKTIPNQATVAKRPGVVKAVTKDTLGGYKVLTKEGEIYNILPGLQATVKRGDSIKSGQLLSTGSARPQDISQAKGHLAAQKYIVDEMDKIYGGNFYKKTFETVVRGTSNTATVENAPLDSQFLRGDTVSIPRLKQVNKKREASGLDPIEYAPKFTSIQTAPMGEDDWLSRLTTRYLKQTIQEGVSKGMATNIHGVDPMPGYLYGEEFGQKGKFY